ncbi:MAG: ATP-binding cassette domain-containing protein [Acidobacteriota bacterium]|nr:ATP-binding cassette domain-containing protein [Acidobacteriota bacterium]
MSAVEIVSPAVSLLDVEELSKRYSADAREGKRAEGVAALRSVSFSIPAGGALGLVGESGSGKTTIARIVARLEDPDSGRIRFDGIDWLGLSGASLRRKRRDLQIVFQDPQTSLNPRMRAGDQIAEPMRVQRMFRGAALSSRVVELLAEVGLDRSIARRFPAELSGGQRQRVAIARALATRPKLVICDEPVSALDVSIAAQIVNLLLSLQRTHGLSYLFISHDLAVVGRVAPRVAVLYAGGIVEEGPFESVAARPLHPYTAILVSSVPTLEGPPRPPRRAGESGAGTAAAPAGGCPFVNRCPIARPRCRHEEPPLAPWQPGRRAACFYPGELEPGL